MAGRRALPRQTALDGLPSPDAVAHRVVHGGEELRAATWVDDDVRRRLQELIALAPLHQPRALAAIDAVARRLGGIRTAACFDTAFHATLPAAAATYALPPGVAATALRLSRALPCLRRTARRGACSDGSSANLRT